MRKKFPPFKVRLWLLGVVSQYHGKIYSFHFSTDICDNDYESLDIQNRLLYKDLQYMAVSY